MVGVHYTVGQKLYKLHVLDDLTLELTESFDSLNLYTTALPSDGTIDNLSYYTEKEHINGSVLYFTGVLKADGDSNGYYDALDIMGNKHPIAVIFKKL